MPQIVKEGMVWVKKKIGVLLVAMFLLCANQAWAHTSLKESTPKDGEILTQSIQELTLTFATKVEQTSTVTVSTSEQETVALDSLVIEDDQIKATFAELLKNGAYEAKWEIIGADGHPMEGSIAFSVDAPVVEEEIAVAPEPEAVEVEAAIVDEVEETESTETANGLSGAQIIFIVMALVIFGGFIWLLKRKK